MAGAQISHGRHLYTWEVSVFIWGMSTVLVYPVPIFLLYFDSPGSFWKALRKLLFCHLLEERSQARWEHFNALLEYWWSGEKASLMQGFNTLFSDSLLCFFFAHLSLHLCLGQRGLFKETHYVYLKKRRKLWECRMYSLIFFGAVPHDCMFK